MFNNILHHLSQISQICQFIAWLLAIAHWIRQLRKEKLGLTQERFAELLHVEPRTVQRWESGDRKPRQEYMMKMQELDGKAIDDLPRPPQAKLRYGRVQIKGGMEWEF